MLVEFRHDSGVVVLRSPLLADAGFAHAFSTRLGGVSTGPFESLNLQSVQANARIADTEPRDLKMCDLEPNIHENHARFFDAARIGRDTRVLDVSQVHGCTVVAASDAAHARLAADAITSAPGEHAILVRIADCVPVLVADPGSGLVAAVHAGWRGVVAEIVPAALRALESRGARRESCIAAIGPCILARHFEIGPEVAEALAGAQLADCVVPPGTFGPKHHADLVLGVRMQLERAGLSLDRIDAEPPCTYANSARFHSFRRDGARSGRLAALIAPAASR